MFFSAKYCKPKNSCAAVFERKFVPRSKGGLKERQCPEHTEIVKNEKSFRKGSINRYNNFNAIRMLSISFADGIWFSV